MKFLQFLGIACCLTIDSSFSSDVFESSEQALLQRASAQLERLTQYRKFPDKIAPNAMTPRLDNSEEDAQTTKSSNEPVALQIYQIISADMGRNFDKKVDGNKAVIDVFGDPKYMAYIQDRIKRSGIRIQGYNSREGYGGGEYETDYGHSTGGQDSTGSGSGGIITGSGNFISGIASGIIGGIVSASGGASKGLSSGSSSSSQPDTSEYGPVHSYDDKTFDVWDFKKAIINTLVQAIKAIGGGVIALKGQLIKGGGFLVSAKGRVITTTGEAITSLGRHIASSAVVKSPECHSNNGYSYDHPHTENGGHDVTYDGPPPSVEEYAGPDDYNEHAHYDSSDDDEQAGLLIVKPVNTNHHDDHHVDFDPRNPETHLKHPEDSLGDQPEGPNTEHIENANSYKNQNIGSLKDAQQPSDYSSPNYDFPNQYLVNDELGVQTYPIYPPLNSIPLPVHSVNIGGPLPVQENVNYPPIHVQQVQYSHPSKNVPKGSTSDNDLSVYSSLSIGLDPHLESIKIATIKHEADYFELPKLQSQFNFHGSPPYRSTHSGFPKQEPLKIPLLNPIPVHYWENQQLLHPMTSFGVHNLLRRKGNSQRRRFINNHARHPFLPNKDMTFQRV